MARCPVLVVVALTFAPAPAAERVRRHTALDVANIISHTDNPATQDAGAEAVKHGDVVYIKVGGKDLWLARQPSGTYCAAAGPERDKAPFVVEFGRFEGLPCIRLKYEEDGSYLGEYRYLYAARTGSTKYDVKSDSTQQMWQTGPDYGVGLWYDTDTAFMARHNQAYMATNFGAPVSNYYPMGRDKVWVEAITVHNLHSGMNVELGFVVQRAAPPQAQLQVRADWEMVQCIRHGSLKKTVRAKVETGSTLSVEAGAEIQTEIEAGHIITKAKVSASMSFALGKQWQAIQSKEDEIEASCDPQLRGPNGMQCMFQWVVEESHYDMKWHTLFTDCVAGVSPPSCPPLGC